MNMIFEQINSTGKAFVEFAFTALIQSSVLIVILLLVDLALRRKVRAVFRYWLWMLVLAKLVLPTSLSSPVSLGYWFGDELENIKIVRQTTAVNLQEAPQPTELEPIEVGISTPPVLSPPAEIIKPFVTTETATEPTMPARAVTPVTWQAVVFLVWLAVVGAMGLLLLQRAIFVRGLVTQAREGNSLMKDALEFCREQMGVKRRVALKVSANATSPAVCGIWCYVILLPRNLGRSLGSRDLRAVLLHELAHIKRGDLWVNFVQTVLQIVYFYNPLLWFANAIIRRVREQAVDETVLVAMGEKAQWYPQTLVSVAKLAFKRPALSLRLIGVVETKSALTSRIKRILNRPIPKTAKLGILGLIAILVTAAVLLPMARAEREIRNPVQLDENGRPIITHILYMWGQIEEPIYQLEDKTYCDVDKLVTHIGELMEQYPFLMIRVRATTQFLRQQEPIEDLSKRCRDIRFINMEFKYDLTLPPDAFQATLPNGVTVELVGVCEYPSKGRRWWRPDGTVLEEAPIEEDRGINVTTGIDRLGRKFAVKLTKLPEGFSDNFADNLKYEIVPCYDHGLSGPVFKNGKPLSDVWLISGSIPSENTHCTLKLLISNDKWVTFKNVSLKPNFKTEVEIEVEQVTENTADWKELTLPDMDGSESPAMLALDTHELIKIQDDSDELAHEQWIEQMLKTPARSYLVYEYGSNEAHLMMVKALEFSEIDAGSSTRQKPIHQTVSKTLPDTFSMTAPDGQVYEFTVLQTDSKSCRLRYRLHSGGKEKTLAERKEQPAMHVERVANWGEAVNGVRARLRSKGPYILYGDRSDVLLEVENQSGKRMRFEYPPQYFKEDRGKWRDLGRIEMLDMNDYPVQPTWSAPLKPSIHTINPYSKHERIAELTIYEFDFPEPGKHKARITFGVQPLENGRTFKVSTNWLEFDAVLTDHIPGTPYTAKEALEEAKAYDHILLRHNKISKAQAADKFLAVARKYPDSQYELKAYFWASVILSGRPVYPDKAPIEGEMEQAKEYWQKMVSKWPDLVLDETVFARHNLAATNKNQFEKLLDCYEWLTSRTEQQRIASATKWKDYFPRQETISEKLDCLNRSLASTLDTLERNLTAHRNIDQLNTILKRFPDTHLAELAQEEVSKRVDVGVDSAWGEAVNGVKARIQSVGPFILWKQKSNIVLEVQNRSNQKMQVAYPPESVWKDGLSWTEQGRVELFDSNGLCVKARSSSRKPSLFLLEPNKQGLKAQRVLSEYMFDFPSPGKYRLRITLEVQPMENGKTFKVSTNWLEFDAVLTGHQQGTAYTAQEAFEEAMAYDAILFAHKKISRDQTIDKFLSVARLYPNSEYSMKSYWYAAAVATKYSSLGTGDDLPIDKQKARACWQEVVNRWPEVISKETIDARDNLGGTDKNQFERWLDHYEWLTSRTEEQKIKSVKRWMDAPYNEEEITKRLKRLNKHLADALEGIEFELTDYRNENQLRTIIKRFPNTHLAELARKVLSKRNSTTEVK